MLQDLRYLLSRREQGLTAVLLFAMFGGALLETIGVGAIPAYVAVLSDPSIVWDNPRVAPLLARFDVTSPEQLVIWGAVGLVVLFVLKNAYLGVLTWYQARFVFNRQVGVSRRLFRAYLNADYAFHLERNSAELLRNTNQEVMEAIGSCLLPSLRLVLEGLTATAIIVLLLTVEPITSLAALGLLGGVSFVFLRAVRERMIHHGSMLHEARGEMIQTVNEGLGGVKVTRVLGREKGFVDAFSAAANRYAYSSRVRLVSLEAPRLLLESVAVCGVLVVAWVMFLQGRPTSALVAPLSLFAVAMVRLIPSFNRIAGALTALRYGRVAIRAVVDDLKLIEPVPTHDAVAPMGLSEGITLDRVSFAYPDSPQPTLEDVSIAIPRGSVVGFVGPTGSGKTTLVDIIMGLLRPVSGRLLVDGGELGEDKIAAWQRSIGYVPQEIYLADDSIRRNVAFGLPDTTIDDAMIWRALDAAQAGDFVRRLSDSLDTTVGERGVRLSGGQRQRLGIARALYADPPVLVLDEATSSLDRDTESAVMEAVEHLRNDHTVLLIAHRLSTVKNCDLLVRVDGGTAEVTSPDVGPGVALEPPDAPISRIRKG